MKNLKLLVKICFTIISMVIAGLITLVLGIVSAGILIIQAPVALLMFKLSDISRGTLSSL